MSYVANMDIEERLGTQAYVGLTDDAGTGQADADKVDEARLGAEGEVDSYLASRYAVPIDVGVHPELAGLLKSITLDLVEFRLQCRRPPVAAEVMRKRDAAMVWLRDVAGGRAKLPAESELPTSQTQSLQPEALGRRRILTDDELDAL